MWTKFMDMHSGGGQKLSWQYIYIEAGEEEAQVIFYNRFGRNPHRVTCTCCGEDYSTDENPDLAQITAFERGCEFVYIRPDGSECPREEGWKSGVGTTKGYTSKWVERANTSGLSMGREYRTLEEYQKDESVKFIYAKDIKHEERKGDVPEEGFVWV